MMICDNLRNRKLYEGLGPRFAAGLAYLADTDLAALEPGRVDVSDGVFVLIQHYDTKPADACKWESHKLYADIQYIIEGEERMGYAPISLLTDAIDHTPGKDTLNYKDGGGHGGFHTMYAGMFAIFYPDDGHCPNVALKEPCANKKAVVKVLL